MINNSEFAARLTKIMDHYQMSASAFADRIQVPRSSISHLLSGRNKPSLEFVLKVVKEFDEIELYWLLNGKGTFPHDISPVQGQESGKALTEGNKQPPSLSNRAEQIVSDKQLEKIVFFYSDGSFKEYHQ